MNCASPMRELLVLGALSGSRTPDLGDNRLGGAIPGEPRVDWSNPN